MNPYLYYAMISALLSIITPVTCALASTTSGSSSKSTAFTMAASQPLHSQPAVKKSSFIKQYLNQLNPKGKKGKGGSIALVIIAAVILSLLLAVVIYAMAFGGASSGLLLSVIGIAGLVLIIFGASRIIRGIKRRWATTHRRWKLKRPAESTATL